VHIAYTIALVIQVILGILMVALILLHPPKGEGMGGIGGAATLFSGKRGAETGLDRATYLVVGLFLLVCTLLGFGIIRP
jgi:preprotein translocase subunit SecG